MRRSRLSPAVSPVFSDCVDCSVTTKMLYLISFSLNYFLSLALAIFAYKLIFERQNKPLYSQKSSARWNQLRVFLKKAKQKQMLTLLNKLTENVN